MERAICNFFYTLLHFLSFFTRISVCSRTAAHIFRDDYCKTFSINAESRRNILPVLQIFCSAVQAVFLKEIFPVAPGAFRFRG